MMKPTRKPNVGPATTDNKSSARSKVTSTVTQASLAAERANLKKSTPRLSKNYINKNCLVSVNPSATASLSPVPTRTTSNKEKQTIKSKSNDSESEGYSSDEFNDGGKTKSADIPESIQKALKITASTDVFASHSPHLNQYMKLESELEKLKQMEKEFRRKQGRQYLQEHQIKNKLNPAMTTTGTTMTTATTNVTTSSSVKGKQSIKPKDKYLEKKESLKQWEKKLREINWRPLPPVQPPTNNNNLPTTQTNTQPPVPPKPELQVNKKSYIPILPMSEDEEPIEETKDSFFQKMFKGMIDIHEGYQSDHIAPVISHVHVTSEDEYSQSSDRNRRSSQGVLPLEDQDTIALQWSSSHLKTKKNIYQNDDKEDERDQEHHIPFIQQPSALQPSTEQKSNDSIPQPGEDRVLSYHEPFVTDKDNDDNVDADHSDVDFEDDYPMPYRDHNSDDDLLDIPVIRLSLSEKLAPLLLSASSKEFSTIPKESQQLLAPAPVKEAVVPKVDKPVSQLAYQPTAVPPLSQKPRREELEESDPMFTMRFDSLEAPKSMVYQRTEREQEKRFSEIPLNKTEEKLLYDRLHSYSAAAYLPPRSFYPVESNRYSSVYSSIEDHDSSGSEGSDDGIPEFSALNAVYKSMRHKKDQEEKEKKRRQLEQIRLKEKETLQRSSNFPANSKIQPLSPQKENQNFLQIPRGEEGKIKINSNYPKSLISPSPLNSVVVETSEVQEDVFRTSLPSQATNMKSTPLSHPDESMFSRTNPAPRPSSSSSAALKLKMEMMQELSKQDQIFQFAMELQELEKPTIDVPLLIATKQRHQQEQQRAHASEAARLEQSRASKHGPAHLEEESNELLVSAESTMKQSERLLQLYVQLQKERAKSQADQKFEQVKSLAATLDNVRFINQIEQQMNDPTVRPATNPYPDKPIIIPEKVTSAPLPVERASSPPVLHSPVRRVEKKTTETQTFESDILPYSQRAESTTQTIESPKKEKRREEKEVNELSNRKTAPVLSPSFIETPLNEEEKQYKMRVFQINQKHKERLLWLDQLISMHLSTNEEANFERRKFESIYQMELQTLEREKYLRQRKSATSPHRSQNIPSSSHPSSSNHDYEEVQKISKRFHDELWREPRTEPTEDVRGDLEEEEDASLKIASYNRPAEDYGDVVRLESDLEGFEENKREPLLDSKDEGNEEEDDFGADDDKLPMDDSLSSSTKSDGKEDDDKEDELSRLQMKKSYEESQSHSRRYTDDDFEVAESTVTKMKEAQDISRSEEIEEEEYSGFPDEPAESEDDDGRYEWTQSNRDYDMSSSSTQQRKKGEYDSDEFEIVDEDIEDEVEEDRYQWTQSNTDYEVTGDSRKGIALSGRYADDDFEVVEEEEREISEEVSEAIEEENVEDNEESRYNQNSFSHTNPDIADSVLYQEDFETSVKPRPISPTLKDEKSMDSMYIQDDFEIEEDENIQEEDIPEEVVEEEDEEVAEVEVTHIGSEYESGDFNYSRTKEESSLEYSKDVAAAVTAASVAFTEPSYEPSYEKTFEDDFEIESRDEDQKEEHLKPLPLPTILDEDENVEEDIVEEEEVHEEQEDYDNESYHSYEPSTNALAISSRKDLDETNRYEDDFVNESSVVPASASHTKEKTDEDEAEVMEEEFEVIEEEDYHDGKYDDDIEAFEKTVEQTNNYENDSVHYESETFLTATQKEDFEGFESMDKSIPPIEMTQPSIPSMVEEEEEEIYSDDKFLFSQTATQSLPGGISAAAAVAATGVAVAAAAVPLTQSQIYDDDDFEQNQSTLTDYKDDSKIEKEVSKQVQEDEDEIIEEEIPEDVESDQEDEEDYTKSFVELSLPAADQNKPSQLAFDDESESYHQDTHSESEILKEKEKSLLASSESQYKAEEFEAETSLTPQKSDKKEDENEEDKHSVLEQKDDDDDFSATYEEEEFEQEDQEHEGEEKEEHGEETFSDNHQPVVSASTKVTKPLPTFEDSIEEEIDEVVEEEFEIQHSEHSEHSDSDKEEEEEEEKLEKLVDPVPLVKTRDEEEENEDDLSEKYPQQKGDEHEQEEAEEDEEKEIDYSELISSNAFEAPSIDAKEKKDPSPEDDEEENYEEEFEEEVEQEEEESVPALPSEPVKPIEIVAQKDIEVEPEEEFEIDEDIEEEIEILEKSNEEELHQQENEQIDLSRDSVNQISAQEELLEESEKDQQKESEILLEDSHEEVEYHQPEIEKINESDFDNDHVAEILKVPSTTSTAASVHLSNQDDDIGELADLNPDVNFQSLQTRKSQLLEGMVALNTSDIAALSESQSAGGLGSGSGTGTAGGLPLQSSSMYFDYEQQKWMGNEEVSLGGFESSVDLSLPGEETRGIALDDDEVFEVEEVEGVVEGLEDLALRERFPSNRSIDVAEMLSIDYSTETVSDIVDSTADGLPIEYLDLPLYESEEGRKEREDDDSVEDEKIVMAREKAVEEISQQLLQRLLQDSFQTVAQAIELGKEEQEEMEEERERQEEEERREMKEREIQRLKQEREREREIEKEREGERKGVEEKEEKRKREKELKEENEKNLAREEEERKRELQRVAEAKEAMIREEKVDEEVKKSDEAKESLALSTPNDVIDHEELIFNAIDAWTVSDAKQRLQQTQPNIRKESKSISPLDKAKEMKDMTTVYRDRLDELYREFTRSRSQTPRRLTLQSPGDSLFAQLFPPNDDEAVKKYLVNQLFADKQSVVRRQPTPKNSDDTTEVVRQSSEDASALFTLKARGEWEVLDHSIGSIVERKSASDLQENCNQIADVILLRAMIEAVESVHNSLLEP